MQSLRRAALIGGVSLACFVGAPRDSVVWAQLYAINTCARDGQPCFTVWNHTEAKVCGRNCGGVTEEPARVYRECCRFDYANCSPLAPEVDEVDEVDEIDEGDSDIGDAQDTGDAQDAPGAPGTIYCTKFPACTTEVCSPIE